MKDTLISIYNALRMVETKGENTLILADCMRALVEVIKQMDASAPSESSEEVSEDVAQ